MECPQSPKQVPPLKYASKFYIMIIDKWKDEYFRINKVNSIMNQFEVTGSTKRFIEYLALVGLNQIGPLNASRLIREWQSKKEIDKKQASDLRRKLKAISNRPGLTEKNELIEELDKKVGEAVEYYR